MKYYFILCIRCLGVCYSFEIQLSLIDTNFATSHSTSHQIIQENLVHPSKHDKTR